MAQETQSPPLLKIEGAMLIKGGRRILDDLHLEIAEGEHTAILGPNGSGKSSLIKLITRQHYPLARPNGQPVMTIFGRDRWNVFELRSLIGIVSADAHGALTMNGEVHGMEIVLSGFFASHGLARHQEVTPAMWERAQTALTNAEAAHLASKPMAEMSTGEARRVLIARSLVADPRALLLDEPTAGLDMAAARRFLGTVRQIARMGKTVVLVTHHVEEIVPEIERIILLKEGRVFRDGPKHDVLTAGNLSTLFGVRIDVHRQGGYYSAEAHESDNT